jgi:hypothetical protein
MARHKDAVTFYVCGETQNVTRGPVTYQLVHGETVDIADGTTADELVAAGLISPEAD